MRQRCLSAVSLFIFCALFALPAGADEIWIAPGEKGDVSVDDWGLTPAGEAHFTFAVPDTLDRFTGAQVIVIGKKNGPITYELHLSISQDGADRSAFTADATGLAATLENGELTALDASSLFPALAGGEDVAALHFLAAPKGDLRVVGLRLQFERFPDHAGLACPPGKFLVGFEDVTGALVCKTLEEVAGGGGGGGELALEIDNVELPEGDTGITFFVFHVVLSEPSATPVTVGFTTRDGTAEAGSDYTAASGTLTFAPGELSKQINVLVTGDTEGEDTEVFFVDLSNATGAVIGNAEGLGRISDDDGAGGGRDD